MALRRKKIQTEIHPDEILIDSSNLPDFDREQFEGRMERPLNQRTQTIVAVALCLLIFACLVRASDLQVARGESFAQQAKNNQLAEHVLFADRGIIADRNGVPLAFNERTNAADEFAHRAYTALSGLAHVVGYVKPPAKDANGQYYRDIFAGMDGAERAFNEELAGQNGLNLTETDAHGAIVSQSTQREPEPGKKITLSIDSQVTHGLYEAIAEKATASGFQGGAGVIMDVQTGELLALTSFPEYSSGALTDGDQQSIDELQKLNQPFLNRAVNGLYAPGSIVKPVMAAAALTTGVIDEHTQILSTGSISVPNQYDPAHPSIFKDWRANGWVDARHAIAVSSDVYFYEVGGGFEAQPGIGIDGIDKFFRLFGFGATTGLAGFSEPTGNIPSPTWKASNFNNDPWRLGDTYHTAIGQYGMQVTPLQAVREAAAIASGMLLTPTLLASSTPSGTPVPVPEQYLQVVREGMRLGVTDGIAQSVNFGFVHVAAKTGTAQVGMHNEFLNSWMIGFFPYEHPRYAYAIVLERGPAGTLVGAPAAAGEFFNWMFVNAPQYLR